MATLLRSSGATDIEITEDGAITGRVDGDLQEFGRLQIALFTNNQGLEAIGGNLFMPTQLSGEATIVEPGKRARAYCAAAISRLLTWRL